MVIKNSLIQRALLILILAVQIHSDCWIYHKNILADQKVYEVDLTIDGLIVAAVKEDKGASFYNRTDSTDLYSILQ